MDDPVDHVGPIHSGLHCNDHAGASPSERIKLVSLRLPVEDIVPHHELVLLDSRPSQSCSTKCQILIRLVKGDGGLLLDLQDPR